MILLPLGRHPFRYEAKAVRDEYISLISTIREQELDATVSVRSAATGYAYSIRRLQENPAMAGTIARATVGRLLGRLT